MDDACWARVDGIRLRSVCGAVGLRTIWQCVESGLRVGAQSQQAGCCVVSKGGMG